MLELIVEVEQRVKGLPVSNSQLWSPPQFDDQTPSSAQGVAVVRDNSVRAPLQPRPGQQTATPNGSMMVPPAPNAQSPMVQASPRREFLVHQDPRVSSGSATPSALPQSGVLREKTYLPVSAPPQFRVASSKLALPHTNPRGPSDPESPNQTQAPTDPSASMQSFSPAARPAMASFHNGFIQKDPSLDQNYALNFTPAQDPIANPCLSQSVIAQVPEQSATPSAPTLEDIEDIEDAQFDEFLVSHSRQSPYAYRLTADSSHLEIIQWLRDPKQASIGPLIIENNEEAFIAYRHTRAMRWFLNRFPVQFKM
jgi:hypothetical protein